MFLKLENCHKFAELLILKNKNNYENKHEKNFISSINVRYIGKLRK